MKLDPKDILQLLGVKAVMLPIRMGTKAPTRKGWSSLKFEQTQSPGYQTNLRNAGAIGVLLGKASENLCSIDFDDDEALAEFLTINPDLAQSLRTKGKRGANIWLKVTDEYPRTFKFKRNGEPAGEWRADGGQTIISGLHKDGGEYSTVVKSPPISVSYSKINWGRMINNSGCHINDINDKNHLNLKNHEKTQTTEITQTPKITQKKEGGRGSVPPIYERIKSCERSREELAKNPTLHKLYREFIANKFTAKQGRRNDQLVAMTTFLYRATSEKIATELVMFFYDLNQDIFIDSRNTHENEMRSHLEATRRTWLASLNPEEAMHYEQLCQISPSHVAAFRVCRELAREDGRFYLSCAHLADRIGTDRKVAYRIFRHFVEMYILAVVEKGTQHRLIEKNGEKITEKGKATVYDWLLIDF